MSLEISSKEKKRIAKKQSFQCANCPKSEFGEFWDYNCPLWKLDDNKFDKAGYKIVSINDNLRAFCLFCYMVNKKYVRRCSKLSDNETSLNKIETNDLTFVMFDIVCNLGADMNGKYFIQLNGNEDQIDKFKKINKKGNVRFYPELYSWNDLAAARKIKGLFKYDASNDNVERLILKGKLTVPGENKSLSEKDLIQWWDTYLDSPKYPKWQKIVETVIDLLN